MSITKKISRMTVAGFLASATLSVSAVPMYFDNQAGFLSAAGGGLGFESYENSSNNVSDTYNYSGFSVSETNGINALTNVAINGSFGSSPVTDGVNAIWYDDNNDSLSNFFSFSSDVNAFGLFVTTNEASTMTISGSSFSTSINLAANTPTFFGVIDTMVAGFTPIQFNASGGPLVGFDGTYFGAASSASVPEPSIIALLSLGLVGIGFTRRKA